MVHPVHRLHANRTLARAHFAQVFVKLGIFITSLEGLRTPLVGFCKGLVGLVTLCKGLVGLGTSLVGFCTHERLNVCELVSE